MQLKIYAIHDSAVNEFTAPDVARTHGEAERKFRANVQNPDNGHLHRSPENFKLFCLGEYETSTGIITPRAPEFVMNAIQCLDDNQRQMKIAATQ